MTWVIICKACTEKGHPIDDGRNTLSKVAHPQRCANCGDNIPIGEGNPWRPDGDPITPSSGNATD